MATTDATARQRIIQQTAQLHQYHLEVKQKIVQKEAEVRAILTDLLDAQKKRSTKSTQQIQCDRRDRGTSPHRPRATWATPTPAPRTCFSASLPTVPAQRLAVPRLRIKGRLPEKEASPPKLSTAPDFLLGAADSLSLVLTGEQRRWGTRQARHTEATTQHSAGDSLALSPICQARPSEDNSLLLTEGHLAAEPQAKPAAGLCSEPKRVRFSSQSPQVDVFSVERTEPRSSAASVALQQHTTGDYTLGNRTAVPDSAGPCCATGPQPTANAWSSSSSPLRNSVQQMLSNIESLRVSLTRSTLTFSSTQTSRSATWRSTRSPSASGSNNSEDVEAATPSPPPPRASRAVAETDANAEEEVPAAVPRRSTRSSESTPPETLHGVHRAAQDPRPTTSPSSIADPLASPIFLHRKRAHRPHRKGNNAVRAALVNDNNTSSSPAVDLSSITVQQATTFLEQYTQPMHPVLMCKSGSTQHIRQQSTRKTVRAPPVKSTKQASSRRVITVSADNDVFERESKRGRVDDGVASSTAISLACGPTLYFT